jgi:hypothetical protein
MDGDLHDLPDDTAELKTMIADMVVRSRHPRREFYRLHITGLSQSATWTIEHMTDLWAVEAQIKGCIPQIRLGARHGASARIGKELQTRWESELTWISEKLNLAEAIRYGLSRKAEFGRFLEVGRVEIDNKCVERAIRRMRPTCAQGHGRRVRRRCALGYAATVVGALTATSMRAFQAQGINSSILVMGWSSYA